MLDYDQMLDEFDNADQWNELPSRYERQSPEAANPFGCPSEFDVEVRMAFRIPGKVVYSNTSADGHLGIHDGAFAFWVRRRSRDTAEELREFLRLIANDLSGTYEYPRLLYDLATAEPKN